MRKKVALHTAFRVLCADLTEATKTYYDRDPNEGKKRALDAVIAFVDKTDAIRLRIPLEHLRADLDPAGGSTMPKVMARNYAACVHAVDLLVDHETPLEDALREVSDATGGKVTAAYLKNFRKNLQRNDTKSPARYRYDRVRSAPWRGRDAREEATIWLEFLRLRFGKRV
jgi:hypothetical protein